MVWCVAVVLWCGVGAEVWWRWCSGGVVVRVSAPPSWPCYLGAAGHHLKREVGRCWALKGALHLSMMHLQQLARH